MCPALSKALPPGPLPRRVLARYLLLLRLHPLLTKAASRFLFTGPLSHYFYLYLEQLIPSNVPFAMVKRLLLDRLVVAPPFLLLFFFVMNLLEGKDLSAFAEKIKSGYWVALKMNWKVWTPVQFINVNYVPMQLKRRGSSHPTWRTLMRRGTPYLPSVLSLGGPQDF
ncbi:peroxisomal membrane protein 2 isoform X3 [Lepidochelys kempii]|uniref:peroxisomal membrane protein 2 isoform X3 n=1 Tax=Lepidochelys kempii TaxID=8472 RepID=UPI003C703A62